MTKELKQPNRNPRKPWCKECRKRHFNVCVGLTMRVSEYMTSIQHYGRRL